MPPIGLPPFPNLPSSGFMFFVTKGDNCIAPTSQQDLLASSMTCTLLSRHKLRLAMLSHILQDPELRQLLHHA